MKWGFKRLFGQELTKDLLIHFLNALLKASQKARERSV